MANCQRVWLSSCSLFCFTTSSVRCSLFCENMHAALLLGSIVLVLVCVIGDKVCSLPALQPSKWALVRALSDNATHGVVGGLSWWIVFGIQWPLGTAASRLNQSLWCAFLASALDLDHFVAAGSINIHVSTIFLLFNFYICTSCVWIWYIYHKRMSELWL